MLVQLTIRIFDPHESCALQVLTFDFHNTLAHCDPWFDLEVRDLPWAVLELLDIGPSATSKARVDDTYRQLRLDVITSGIEIDAYDAVWRIFDDLGVVADKETVRLAIDDLMYRSTLAMEPVAGAVQTVRHLHAAGVRLGVISSAVHHLSLDWILDRLSIAECFDSVVTSASCGYYKSTTAIYDVSLGHLGGDAATSVHVGDSLRWDVATAQQAGMTAVWLQTPRRETFAAKSPDVTPSLTLQTLEQAGPVLVDLLERVRVPVDA